MKKLVLLTSLLLIIIACKQKETKPEETVVEPVEVAVEETAAIDYESFGMQNDDVPKGLEKGSKAPDVDLIIDGKKMALADLYKDQKVALIFYRGFWCPRCNKHLSEFASKAKDLEAKGIKLIAITPETLEGVEKTKEKTGADFTIVTDLDGSLLKAFDVDFKVTEGYAGKVNQKLKVAIDKNNASGLVELPVPATYVIDTDGTIIYSHFDPNYANRASVEDILAAL